jgi:hypothetical protein
MQEGMEKEIETVQATITLTIALGLPLQEEHFYL